MNLVVFFFKLGFVVWVQFVAMRMGDLWGIFIENGKLLCE